MNTPLNSPLPSAKMAVQGRTRQCHGCHGPCDDSHRGYPTGADRCTLEHDDRCEGGIVLTDWIENGEGVPLDMSPLKMIIRMEIYKKILFLFMVESWVLSVR